jgi:hypothetical protein
VELGLRRGRATGAVQRRAGEEPWEETVARPRAALEVVGVRGVAAPAARADSELGLLRGAHRGAGRQEPQVSP